MHTAHVTPANPPAGLTRQLLVAVPNLGAYSPMTGVGRVLHSLRLGWGDRVTTVEAALRASSLPVLQNLPYGVRAPAGADLVLMPQLTGAQALADTAGLPSVALVHDVGIVDFPGDRVGMNRMTRVLVRRGFRGLRHADLVIAVSHFTARRIIAHHPRLAARIHVVPNGVDERFLRMSAGREEALSQVRAILGGPPGTPLLLNVGSELPRKNLGLLFAAFAAVRARHPGAMLIKVGAPGHPRWRARTLRLAAAHGLTLGRELRLVDQPLSDDALAILYRAADVFASPSLYEGFGLPALEAMACGTPVVVTDRGAYPEVVGDAGLVVEPTEAAFAGALEAALSGAGRERWAAAGRLRAAQLRWASSAERCLSLLSELAATPRPLRTGSFAHE